MKKEVTFQTLGTISSLGLGIITIELFISTKNHDIYSGHDIFWELVNFAVMMLAFMVMARTGVSFKKSLKDNSGINYLLYFCLATINFLGIPLLLIVGTIVDFGKHWFLMLLIVTAVVIWGNYNDSKKQKKVRTA
ncbi:hypothetical protein [Paenisporosarcina sp. NPDC076898]|uniref:hypothetical protein n=1 Tax=unclassified Paenisporosarcina TaxID=2642018 RepID=UPI003D056899